MNRDEFLKQIANRETIEVKVSFGVVKIQPLTRLAFDHCQALALKVQQDPTAERIGGMRFQVMAQGLVDDDGKRLLDSKSKTDRDLFDTFNAGDSEAICEAILDASRISQEDRDFLLKS